MSLADQFSAIFDPLCAAIASLFNSIFGGLGFDFNQVCTSIGDLFRSALGGTAT